MPRKYTMPTPHWRVRGPRGPTEPRGCIGARCTPLATSVPGAINNYHLTLAPLALVYLADRPLLEGGGGILPSPPPA